MSDQGMRARLREEREGFGVSQEVFGKWGGVSFKTQNKYEKQPDARPPDANYFAGLAEKGVDILYIITGKRGAENSNKKTVSVTEALQIAADCMEQKEITDQLTSDQLKNLIGYIYTSQATREDILSLLEIITEK